VKIALIVTGRGYSFTNQARALQAALESIGVESRLDLISSGDIYNPADGTDVIIPIGAWQDYDDIIELALKTGIPTLPWIVADIVIDGKPTKIDPIIANKLQQLPLFLTTSQYCKQNFIKNGMNDDHIWVLPECVNEDTWHPYNNEETQSFLDILSIDEETKTALPLHFNLKRAKRDGVPILFTTGGVATGKGVLEVIKALGKIDPNKEWIYIIKTWPSNPSFTSGIVEMQLAKDVGIAHKLRYISGEFADKFLIGLMNTCDIYVAPSRSEGFGLPLVEAQLCNKMIVTHNATATSETVINDVTGLVAKAYVTDIGEAFADVDDLAEKLKLAIYDNELRSRLSNQARQSAIDRFGKQTIGNKCLSLVQDALSIIGGK
jgi:glycosyltransferase involved in cell wall biosynthesis